MAAAAAAAATPGALRDAHSGTCGNESSSSVVVNEALDRGGTMGTHGNKSDASVHAKGGGKAEVARTWSSVVERERFGIGR